MSSSRPPVIVFVPELEALLRQSGSVPRWLVRMLRVGRQRSLDTVGIHGEMVTGKAIAPAALTRRIDCPDDAGGSWIRADPVVLTPDLSAVWLQTGARVSPQAVYVDELSKLFAAEGITLDFPVPERGYLRLEQEPDCRFTPPWRLAGESMDLVFPQGREARRWRWLLNESQMLLHQHHHLATDKAAVPGSLWFWGAGQLPARDRVAARIGRIEGRGLILQALADWLEIELVDADPDALPAPGTLFEWTADPEMTADSNLERLQSFIRPLWRRLRFGRPLRALELASLGHCWRFMPGDTWRVWT